jgi:cystathionine gamma-synthase
MHPQTLAVTAGRPRPVADAPFNPPVVFASTYVGSPDVGDGSYGYGRDGNATWSALEDAIGALEGGRALAFASGLAAAYAVLELVEPRSTVVVPDGCYLGVAAAFEQRAARLDWTLRRVDITDTEQVLTAAAGAQLLWLESPSNPLMAVADLSRVAAERPAGVRMVVDNTFATPVLQRPLELGADIVLHSATKLISGHSDVLMGALVTADPDTFAALATVRHDSGAIPGPMEAYLALRGLRTLPLRIAQAQASAQVLATRMAERPAVRRVRYPGFGSLVSIELADGPTADAMVAACRLWVFATSLGGVESTLERRRRWPAELATVPEGLVRLSVGIEHVDDLWADLSQALDSLS